ncbi:hypothetical protein D3C85_1692270 [compost metagenome]
MFLGWGARKAKIIELAGRKAPTTKLRCPLAEGVKDLLPIAILQQVEKIPGLANNIVAHGKNSIVRAGYSSERRNVYETSQQVHVIHREITWMHDLVL